MKPFGLFCILLLAACGVDGEPTQPAGGAKVTLGSGNDVGLGATIGLRRPDATAKAEQ
ncbi:MAG: hypothetical protein ABJN72_02945 [Sulfitobacter sp.]